MAESAREQPGGARRSVPGSARRRAVRDPESVGRGLGARARRARLPGARDDELGLRLHARAPRRASGRWTRSPCTSSRWCARPTCRSRSTWRTATPRARGCDHADRRGRRSRRVDRGLGSRRRPLRAAERGRARRGRSRRGSRARVAVHAHGAGREPHPGQPGPRRHDRAPTGIRAGGSGRPYAPGLATADEIRAVCSAVSKPVNVLARPNLTMAEIAEAGGRRVSVGGALTWTAVNAFVEAATAIRERGDFSSLGDSSGLQAWLS